MDFARGERNQLPICGGGSLQEARVITGNQSPWTSTSTEAWRLGNGRKHGSNGICKLYQTDKNIDLSDSHASLRISTWGLHYSRRTIPKVALIAGCGRTTYVSDPCHPRSYINLYHLDQPPYCPCILPLPPSAEGV